MNQWTARQLLHDPLIRLILAGYLLFLLVKLYLIGHLDLFGDEAFYWQCAQRLALTFSDHPFMTALLVKAGTMMAGDSAFGVRLMFLLAGSLLPFAVYWLALPYLGRRDAILAGGACLLIPIIANAGAMALPDFPLNLLVVLSLGSFERATRTGATPYWILTGLFGVLGLCVHYRFVLIPAAAFIYLIATRNGRQQWRNPGLWLCGLILLAGAGLILQSVLNSGLGSLNYQFLERHPLRFQVIGLLHPVVQALSVTPLIYLVLLLALFECARRGWHGEDRYALLALTAGLHTAAYWLLAPWSDTSHTTHHWPLPGYLPLLVAVPATLNQLAAWFGNRYGERMRRLVRWLIPASGIAGCCWLAFKLTITAQFAHGDRVLPELLLGKRMIGWSQLADKAGSVLADHPDLSLVFTDFYYAGSQLELSTGLHNRVFVLEDDYLRREGRASQYESWRLNERWFRRVQEGGNALVVLQMTTGNNQYNNNIEQVCRMFDSLQQAETLSVLNNQIRYNLYIGRGIHPPERDNKDLWHCHAPARVILDQPLNGDRVAGNVVFAGWAFSNNGGIASVELLVDGNKAGAAQYGMPRPDVHKAYPDSSDSQHPDVGFRMHWDSTTIQPGWHDVSLRISSNNGLIETREPRQIWVDSPANHISPN